MFSILLKDILVQSQGKLLDSHSNHWAMLPQEPNTPPCNASSGGFRAPVAFNGPSDLLSSLWTTWIESKIPYTTLRVICANKNGKAWLLELSLFCSCMHVDKCVYYERPTVYHYQCIGLSWSVLCMLDFRTGLKYIAVICCMLCSK